jgi:hypothetical protein
VSVRLVGVALVAGCYNPTIGTGSPCTTSSECPGDLACVAGTCGGTVDAGVSSDVTIMADAPAPPGDAAPIELTFGDDPAEVHDTEIWLSNPSTNYGTGVHFSIDLNESGLVWFDLTSVPAGKTVTAAKLTLTVADYADAANGTATIHRLREAWIEAEATWTVRATNQAWSVAGARSPASDMAPAATFTPAAIETAYDVTLPPALVQSWIDDPAMNFGLVIMRGTSTNHVHIHSRDSGTAPKLTISVY